MILHVGQNRPLTLLMIVEKRSFIFVFMVIFYHRQSVAHVSINTSVGVNDNFIVGRGFRRWECECVCVCCYSAHSLRVAGPQTGPDVS